MDRVWKRDTDMVDAKVLEAVNFFSALVRENGTPLGVVGGVRTYPPPSLSATHPPGGYPPYLSVRRGRGLWRVGGPGGRLCRTRRQPKVLYPDLKSGPCKNPGRAPASPTGPSGIVTRLNTTSSIPAGKPLPVPVLFRIFANYSL